MRREKSDTVSYRDGQPCLRILNNQKSRGPPARLLAGGPKMTMVIVKMMMILQVTPDSLASMKERISKAAELILPGVRLIIIIMTITITTILRLDMLGYGCTSASAVLGEEVVFSQLASRYL